MLEAADDLNLFIKDQGYDKVVLVAHSMGGLVASEYLSLGQAQRNTVEKLITLGTPFLGAPKAIPILSSGKALGGISDLVVAKAIKEIAPNLSSVWELFPTWYYIKDRLWEGYVRLTQLGNFIDTYNDTKTYLSQNLPFNEYLFSKSKDTHDRLFVNGQHITSFVDSYYIVGTNESTCTSTFLNGEEFVSVNTNAGDGTVPAWSADISGRYPAKTYYASNRAHGANNGNGLVDAENVLLLVSNIIMDRPNVSVNGIIHGTKPYNTNGWIAGENDQQSEIILAPDEELRIIGDDGKVLYSDYRGEEIYSDSVSAYVLDNNKHIVITAENEFESN